MTDFRFVESAGLRATEVATTLRALESYVPAATGVDVLLEPFNNFTFAPWSNSGGTIGAARHGNGATMGSFAQAIYTIPSGSRDGTITVGCAVKIAAGTNQLFGFWWPGGGTFHGRVSVNLATGALFCAGATGSNIGSSAGSLITTGTWYYVEAQFFMHDTAGTAIVRLDGVVVINVAGSDTRAGSPTTYESVQIGPPNSSGGGSVQYDDLYITMGAGAPFKGDITVP